MDASWILLDYVNIPRVIQIILLTFTWLKLVSTCLCPVHKLRSMRTRQGWRTRTRVACTVPWPHAIEHHWNVPCTPSLLTRHQCLVSLMLRRLKKLIDGPKSSGKHFQGVEVIITAKLGLNPEWDVWKSVMGMIARCPQSQSQSIWGRFLARTDGLSTVPCPSVLIANISK